MNQNLTFNINRINTYEIDKILSNNYTRKRYCNWFTQIITYTDCKNNDIKIKINNANDLIQYWLKNCSYWEIEILQELKKLIPKNSISVDIGAYIGTYSLYLATYLDNIVYAFEPSFNRCHHLTENIRINRLDDSILPIEAGVWNRDSWLEINTPRKKNKGITFTREIINKITDIAAIKLDTYFQNEEISFIKIDTEGRETQILYGAERIIKINKPILLIEIHGNGTILPKYILDLDYYYKPMKANWSEVCRHYILIPAELVDGENFKRLENKVLREL